MTGSMTVEIKENSKDRTFTLTSTMVETVSADTFVKLAENIRQTLNARKDELETVLPKQMEEKTKACKGEIEMLEPRLKDFVKFEPKAKEWRETEKRKPEAKSEK